jgi:hypothetical protein
VRFRLRISWLLWRTSAGKGKRVPELENELVERLMQASGKPRWAAANGETVSYSVVSVKGGPPKKTRLC